MSMPEWWAASGKKKQNRRSARQESRHAREVGGRVQPGSGSSPNARGDVKSADYLDELKYTDAKSFAITVAMWYKIENAALSQGREPRLIIELSEHNLTLEVVRRA